MVWLTALLASCLAILPSMAARALTVVLNVNDKHKVGSVIEKGIYIYIIVVPTNCGYHINS